MPLRPYEEFAPEPLAFPIKGKVYTAPLIGYIQGLRIQEMIAAGPGADFEETPEDVWRMVLGDAFDKMKGDNVPADALARAGLAALTDYHYGREAAEQVWESGVDPKALTEALTRLAESKAQSKAPSKAPATKPSRSTASGNRTQRRASTRSTTSRKK